MNIWIVTIGEPVPVQAGLRDRLQRSGYFAHFLAKHGHRVTWWASTFDHIRKKHLFHHDTHVQLNDYLNLKLVYGCGYKNNISLSRLFDHRQIASKFKRMALNEKPPDIILCSLPILDLSVASIEYAEKKNIPVVIDVRDLWPDVFLDICPQFLRPLAKAMLYPMFRNVRKACVGATAIIGPTKSYVNWGLMKGKRRCSVNDISFPFGYPKKMKNDGEVKKGIEYWKSKGISNDNGMIICFFGTIGHQFDLEAVIDAARLIQNDMLSVRFVLCGSGDKIEYYKNLSKNISNILYPGWIGSTEIHALMEMSSIGLAPYKETKNFLFNIPNKVGEYLSYGLPIAISLCKGELFDLVSKNRCGFSYFGNSDNLAKMLKEFINYPDKLKLFANNARRVFEEFFEAEKVYGKMMEYLQNIANDGGKNI